MAKKKAETQVVAVVEDPIKALLADPDTHELTIDATHTIGSWLGRFAQFLTEGKQRQADAAAFLLKAQALPQPTDQTSDAVTIALIREANAGTKAAATYWSIAGAVHRVHRKLTALRDAEALNYEAAAAALNAKRNVWVKSEAQRVEREQAERRRLANKAAEAERARELETLEAEALAREEATDGLSEREQIFVAVVAAGHTPRDGAYRAGYKDINKQADRLAATPKIIEAIKALREAVELRRQQAEVKAAPVIAAPIAAVESQVAAGGKGRKTYKPRVHDVEAFIAAVFAGTIPRDVLTIDEVVLNRYTRDVPKVVQTWPGVTVVEDSKTF